MTRFTDRSERRDYVGSEYTLGKAVKDLSLPLGFDDIHDQPSQDGVGKSLVTVPQPLTDGLERAKKETLDLIRGVRRR